MRASAILIAAVGCGRIAFDPLHDAGGDAAIDAPPPPCLSSLRIGASGGLSYPPAIARIGDQLGVVWQAEPDAGGFTTTLTLVAADGTTTDVALPSIYSPSVFKPYLVAVAASSSVYAVAWTDAPGAQASVMWFAIVGTDGVMRAGPTLVEPAFEETPSLLWTGTSFVLAYTVNESMPPTIGQPSPVKLLRFDEAGVVAGPATDISDAAAVASNPSLALVNGNLVAIWPDGRNSGSDLYVAMADLDGAKLGPDTMIASMASFPALAWNGNTLLAAYQDLSFQLHLATLDATTGALIGASIAVPGNAFGGIPVWDGSRWVLLEIVKPTDTASFALFDAALTELAGPSPVWPGVSDRAWLDVFRDRAVFAVSDNENYPQDIYLTELCGAAMP